MTRTVHPITGSPQPTRPTRLNRLGRLATWCYDHRRQVLAAWLFALWILAPVCAGFLVARLAKIVPLVHGLVVSMVALVIFVLVYDFAKLLTGFVFLIWVVLNVACSVFGAWLWRRQSGALA